MHILPCSFPMKRSSATFPQGCFSPAFVAILLPVSRLSRAFHRVNLLECGVIPDKMTIFSSVPSSRCPITRGTFNKKKRTRAFGALRSLMNIYVLLFVFVREHDECLTPDSFTTTDNIFCHSFISLSLCVSQTVNFYTNLYFYRSNYRTDFLNEIVSLLIV